MRRFREQQGLEQGDFGELTREEQGRVQASHLASVVAVALALRVVEERWGAGVRKLR